MPVRVLDLKREKQHQSSEQIDSVREEHEGEFIFELSSLNLQHSSEECHPEMDTDAFETIHRWQCHRHLSSLCLSGQDPMPSCL